MKRMFDFEFFPADTRNLTQRSLRSERMEKGGFLIGEEIAHVPHSWDALTRAKGAKRFQMSECRKVGTRGCGFRV